MSGPAHSSETTKSHDARERRLKRWVKQPPVGPNMQYLRDAERLAAVERLGHRDRVLDVASESTVTATLDADDVVRLDFSAAASDTARDVLGDAVDAYEVTEPETPTLPFPDDHFDGAVSIGPYDWKFLDVPGLTAEVHRVTKSDGLYVFSVPTPRSPYAANGDNRFYEPDEALDVVSPNWHLADFDLLFQYPRLLHLGVNALPDRYQERFVDAAERLSEELTERELWRRASYIVLAVRPMKYDSYLERGLEALFRPTAENGFWDEVDDCIIRALTYEFDDDGSLVWSRDESQEWRYAPMALMGAMNWRTSPLGTDEYDAKLRREFEFFDERIESGELPKAMPSYGVGPLLAAYAMAAEVFEEERDDYLASARTLFEHADEAVEFDHAEDSLALYGATYLHEAVPDDERVEAFVDRGLWEISDRRTPEGLYGFDNHTTRRHQNQMYTCWAVARAIEVTGKTGYLGDLEDVLDYTVENRMREDGAFVWEDWPLHARLYGELRGKLTTGTPYWHYLYECHQTFFVNAVAHYDAAGGEKEYTHEVRRAMAWIFETNGTGHDLVDISEIGVPMRQVTTDDRMDNRQFTNGWRDQQYKGTYEVGSYVMALTHLLDGTVS
ncbi:class I SAM-dependent methyltransferase [Halogeometricum sp. S1BR25-6]|uniref:Class I SAM-dependent methyltransferase n=1 Tax=Halogeometricum salsisoli TaxID=2950536 RepID=A0ABU2GHZ3_9EURY|nr:methyltransferase domain-containing protein [Halogeometricum sp. S1BR25-6]MDS0300452.1 class I SAM-dependent methyltransferase [Halogeometricum sp. S1BR25-6]